MSTSLTAKCAECGVEDYLDVYLEGWSAIEFDCSKAVCHRCQVLTAPEEWYDYRCTGCNGWFNVSRKLFDGEPRPKVEMRKGPVCLPCAESLLAEQ